MRLIESDSGHVLLEFDITEANDLATAIRRQAGHMSNGALELASLLREAHYSAQNHFRQPPHAFDEKAPRPPSTRG